MKESTARIGDGRKKEEGHDKTVSECFPCLWPEINDLFFLGERLHNIIEKYAQEWLYLIICSKFLCSIIVISGTELRP